MNIYFWTNLLVNPANTLAFLMRFCKLRNCFVTWKFKMICESFVDEEIWNWIFHCISWMDSSIVTNFKSLNSTLTQLFLRVWLLQKVARKVHWQSQIMMMSCLVGPPNFLPRLLSRLISVLVWVCLIFWTLLISPPQIDENLLQTPPRQKFFNKLDWLSKSPKNLTMNN